MTSPMMFLPEPTPELVFSSSPAVYTPMTRVPVKLYISMAIGNGRRALKDIFISK